MQNFGWVNVLAYFGIINSNFHASQKQEGNYLSVLSPRTYQEKILENLVKLTNN